MMTGKNGTKGTSLDLSKLLIRDVIGRLTVPQLWLVIGALFGMCVISFGLGYEIASKVGEVRLERSGSKADFLNRELQEQVGTILDLQTRCGDRENMVQTRADRVAALERQLEETQAKVDADVYEKIRMEARLSLVEARMDTQNVIVSLFALQQRNQPPGPDTN
jgi:hypothetical protein